VGEVTSYKPGTFSWVDLGTPDPEAAKDFYSQVMGWTPIDLPVGDGFSYTMMQIDGKDVAALYQMSEEQQEQGVPSHWAHYVTVANVEEAAAKAEALGGTLLLEPFDVMEAGRMAAIQDPTGATLAVWEPRDSIGASWINDVGSFCWNELATWEPEAASDFYTGLFDWDVSLSDSESPGDYWMFMNGENPAAGMLQMNEEWGDMPAHWMIYFAIDDCDEKAELVTKLGGKVHHGPADIPSVGRFAIVTDPQGAVFTLIKLESSE
jgi:hypothetical protein